MTVSIVIPCFNQAQYLHEAIASARAQTWPDVEVIVVDDGSTDGSAAVAEQVAGVRLVRQANHGLSGARNAGLRASRGDVLIFLDADDRLLPHAAAHAVAALRAHPDALLAFGACEAIDEAGRSLPTPVNQVAAADYGELLARNFIWMPGMAAIRRTALDTLGSFDARVNASADYDLYLRIASSGLRNGTRTGALVFHGHTVAQYRQHAASMSRDPVLMFDTTMRVLQAQHGVVSGNPRLESALRDATRAWRAFYGEQIVDAARGAWRRGLRAEALTMTLQLMRRSPGTAARHARRKLRLLVAPYAGRASRADEMAAATSRASAGSGKR